jgi:hypothetical protein
MFGRRRANIYNIAGAYQLRDAGEDLPAIFSRQGLRPIPIGIVKSGQLNRQRSPSQRMPAAHGAAADNTHTSHGISFPA